MKRITIYAHNEEIAALRPIADRLTKKGAHVVFSAIKWREVQKTDQVLTLPHHLWLVRDLYQGTGVPVQVIQADEIVEPEPAPVVELAPVAPALTNPDDTVMMFAGDPTPVVSQVSEPAPVEVEPLTITVAEPETAPTPAPTPSPRRTRK